MRASPPACERVVSWPLGASVTDPLPEGTGRAAVGPASVRAVAGPRARSRGVRGAAVGAVSIPPTFAPGHSPSAGTPFAQGASSPRLCLHVGGGPCPCLADAWAPNLAPRPASGQRRRAVPAPRAVGGQPRPRVRAPCLSLPCVLPPPPGCCFRGQPSADLPHASSCPLSGTQARASWPTPSALKAQRC